MTTSTQPGIGQRQVGSMERGKHLVGRLSVWSVVRDFLHLYTLTKYLWLEIARAICGSKCSFFVCIQNKLVSPESSRFDHGTSESFVGRKSTSSQFVFTKKHMFVFVDSFFVFHNRVEHQLNLSSYLHVRLQIHHPLLDL